MLDEPDESDRGEDPLNLEWRWDETGASGSHVTIESHGNAASVAVAGAAFAVQAERPSGETSWSYAVPSSMADAASLVARDGIVYAALYRAHATGGRVVALDAATGRPIWNVPLQGLGPLHHSKYDNRLQLALIGDWLVVFGDESAGRYIEMLDPVDGHLVGHRLEAGD